MLGRRCNLVFAALAVARRFLGVASPRRLVVRRHFDLCNACRFQKAMCVVLVEKIDPARWASNSSNQTDQPARLTHRIEHCMLNVHVCVPNDSDVRPALPVDDGLSRLRFRTAGRCRVRKALYA